MARNVDNIQAMDNHFTEPATIDPSPAHPFRRAVLRGLGVVLPPLLTIVFLLWMWNAVRTYILTPAKDLALAAAVQQNWDVLTEPPQDVDPDSFGKDTLGQVKTFKYNNRTYARLPSDEWIPSHVFKRVREHPARNCPSRPKVIIAATMNWSTFIRRSWCRCCYAC